MAESSTRSEELNAESSNNWISDVLISVMVGFAFVGAVGLAIPRPMSVPHFLILIAGLGGTAWALRSIRRTGRPKGTRWAPNLLKKRTSTHIKGSSGLVLGVAATTWGLGRKGLNFPFFGPVGRSVDAAHHVAMIAWITDHSALPSKVEPELRQFSEYFLFPHRVVATLAGTLQLPPLRAVGLFGILLFLGLLLLSADIAGRVVFGSAINASTVAFAQVGCFAVAASLHRFLAGMILRDYFFGQLMGICFVVSCCLAIVEPRYRGLIPILGAASMACYPLSAPLVPAILFVSWLITRQSWVFRCLLKTVGAGAVLLLVQAPYLGGSADMATQEGSITSLTLATVGGPAILALVAAGFLRSSFPQTESRTKHFDRAPQQLQPGTVLCLAFALTFAEYLAFLLGGRANLVSRYSGTKILYSISPFAAALGGVGLGSFVHLKKVASTPRPLKQLLVVVTTAWIMFFTGFVTDGVSSPVDPDAYRMGQAIRDTVPADRLGFVGIGLNPYFLTWIDGRGAVPDRVFDLLGPQQHWRDWPNNRNDKEDYLVVVGEPYITMFSARPGVTVVRRSGNAVLLKKRPQS